jgi:hypothetical protein
MEQDMAEGKILHAGQSTEEVAYTLFRHIAIAEGKKIDNAEAPERKWILDTYAECLRTVRNPTSRLQKPEGAKSAAIKT